MEKCTVFRLFTDLVLEILVKQIRFWLDNSVVDGPLIEFLDPSKRVELNIHEKMSDYITQNETWNIQLLQSDSSRHCKKKTIPSPMVVIQDKMI